MIGFHYRDLEEILNETLPKPVALEILGEIRLPKVLGETKLEKEDSTR